MLCKCCKTEKPDTEFYAGAAKCKECVKRVARENRERKIQDPVWRALERERCRIKQAKRREYLAAHGIKENSRSANLRWLTRNPEKRKAQQAANNALRAGQIERKPNCQRCGGNPPLEMHHDDYAKPLDVIWLCLECHAKTRRKGDAPIERRAA